MWARHRDGATFYRRWRLRGNVALMVNVQFSRRWLGWVLHVKTEPWAVVGG